MSTSLRDAILAAVPADGSSIGNLKLFRAIQGSVNATGEPVTQEAVQAIREALVSDGILGRGRGRGGSVFRCGAEASSTSAAAPVDSVPELAASADAKADVDADAKTGADADADTGTAAKTGTAVDAIAQQKTPSASAQLADHGAFGTYRHQKLAKQRPDVGIQDQFSQHRSPKRYRYDSSLAPELCWDESAERDLADWLLTLITAAAEQGEQQVFAEPQRWLGSGELFRSTRECAARLKSLTQPFLNWAGKAERHQISVPTVPLFVHERHSTRAILERLQRYKSAGQNLDLFGDPQLDLADKLDAYQHQGPWTNRLILGDSLQVMNSLLEYEGLGGQVQMIYIDPPYGVKFGSNFQPFVRKRDVKHGQDAEMIREPEMVKAYRDTWELGLHSYLSYLRDRLLLARELLTESGSVFVQISDENLHHVREVMDEVLLADNFVALITFSKTSSATSDLLPSTADYLLWYCKDKNKIKYNSLYKAKKWGEAGDSAYSKVELPNGQRRSLTKEERLDTELLPASSRIYRIDNLTSQRPPGSFPVLFDGNEYRPKRGYWKTGKAGFKNLDKARRLESTGTGLYYVRYFSDFPVYTLTNRWDDTGVAGFAADKLYVVQTNIKVIQRCLLMTTDPGDLVLDPTCGSGTTAYVAEHWGRRWITCDTSRVPLALARQRLLTATFPWHELKEPTRGPAAGFRYARKQNRKGEEVGGLVPRITLKSIANDEEPETVTLVDRPEQNAKITRVCGPFTVEATIQAAATLDSEPAPLDQTKDREARPAEYENPRAYIDRMIEVLRRAHRLRLPGNQSLDLEGVRPVADGERLHAEAISAINSAESDQPQPQRQTQPERQPETQLKAQPQRIAIVFGPENGAIDSQFVFDAASDAHFLRYDQLYLFGFAIEAKARELVSDQRRLRIPATYINVTPDVVMSDLLKTSQTDQLFSITGLPDARLETAGATATGEPLYRLRMLGLDTFRPDTLETESVAAEHLPCWMLDTDYNGLVFCASQVFFPRTAAWDNLQKSLKAAFDASVWEHLAGAESEPFTLGAQRCVAVKVIDERGNELMAVRRADEARH
ncbi:site-specific DNA-methyltransferase [Lamprobacter modestohalophilus]|uniref:site-specific DNA-methyltransferase (adenine-specific) n=1 Tax=Lamprobacter modestohalophilus TaxID=1064514 RepID=A0A9X1B2S0_9GAMM|nr:site-specific DNA-methyltransferase [Lamprobacter modestohalophilus]MBK1616906.1 site-specific DNA-methyltransferase [Lamprobacter modestohalophilus]